MATAFPKFLPAPSLDMQRLVEPRRLSSVGVFSAKKRPRSLNSSARDGTTLSATFLKPQLGPFPRTR